jgi:steroid delta-isomerase-like uncharacterized protein
MADAGAIAREYLEAVPRHDFDKVRELFHPQYSFTGGDGRRQEGADAGIAVTQMYTTAFPDVKLDIKSIHVAGNVAIVEFVANGTHQGELMGIAPTGRKISVPVCNVLEIRDGKVYAEREYFDMAHMMQQLGVTQIPAATTV